MRIRTPSFALVVFFAALGTAFADSKADFLSRKLVRSDPGIKPDVLVVVQKIQKGETPPDVLKQAIDEVAPALKLDEAEKKQALDLYGIHEAVGKKGEALGKRMDGLVGALGGLAGPQGLAKGYAVSGGPNAGHSGTGPDLAALNAKRGAQTNLKPDQGGAPPVVLADIVQPPPHWYDNIYAKYIGGKYQRANEMLSRVPTSGERESLDQGYKYLKENGALASSVPDLISTPDEGGEMVVHMNYANLGPKAYGATIPLVFIAESHHGEESRISLSQGLQNAPVEVRALVIGHENWGHAIDNHNGLFKNAGAHIPSEVRAAVIDACNYLVIRSKTDDARRKVLAEDGVWQQDDLKARIILEKEISLYNYKDDNAYKDAYRIDKFLRGHPGAKAAQVIREYVRMKYESSGEEGMDKIGLKDDSPVGQFNRQVDAFILKIQAEATEKEWLKYNEGI